MLLQRIQQQFIDSADLKYQCAQAIAPAVENAIQAVLASVTVRARSWLLLPGDQRPAHGLAGALAGGGAVVPGAQAGGFLFVQPAH